MSTATGGNVTDVIELGRFFDRRAFGWQDILQHEPDLRGVERFAELADPNDWHAYEAIKRMMRPLVGREARSGFLRTREAWDCAHDHLLGLFESKPKPPKKSKRERGKR